MNTSRVRILPQLRVLNVTTILSLVTPFFNGVNSPTTRTTNRVSHRTKSRISGPLGDKHGVLRVLRGNSYRVVRRGFRDYSQIHRRVTRGIYGRNGSVLRKGRGAIRRRYARRDGYTHGSAYDKGTYTYGIIRRDGAYVRNDCRRRGNNDNRYNQIYNRSNVRGYLYNDNFLEDGYRGIHPINNGRRRAGDNSREGRGKSGHLSIIHCPISN